MADLNQITVNVNDIIPPDNFATVDTVVKIGSVYTKEQDNAWRKEVEENTNSGIKGVAKPDDTVPTTGFFRMLANNADTYTNYLDINDAPIIVTDADLNVVNSVQRNEVIIEVNNGISEKKVFAKVGADGANGTATIPQWVAGDYSPDAMVVHEFVQFITPDGSLSSDIPGESSKWIKMGGDDTEVRSVLKWFLEQETPAGAPFKTYSITEEATNPVLFGVTSFSSRMLQKTNTTIVVSQPSGVVFNVFLNLPISQNGVTKVKLKIIPYLNNSPDHCTLLGVKPNGDIVTLILSENPNSLHDYEFNVTDYEFLSFGWVSVDGLADSFLQKIEFYNDGTGGGVVENIVKDYVDTKVNDIVIYTNRTLYPLKYGFKETNTEAQNKAILDGLITIAYNEARSIEYPEGLYQVSNVVMKPCHMYGKDRNTMLESKSATPMFVMEPQWGQANIDNHTTDGIAGGYYTGFEIAGFGLKGNDIATKGFWFSKHAFAHYDRLFFHGFSDVAIHTEGMLICTFGDIEIRKVQNGIRADAFTGYAANLVCFDYLNIEGCRGVGVHWRNGSGIHFKRLDTEKIGTAGDVNTGALHFESIYPVYEGMMGVTIDKSWAEDIGGGFYAKLESNAIHAIRDTNILKLTFDAQNSIINNGGKLLVENVNIDGGGFGLVTSNGGQTLCQGFNKIPLHTELSGGTFKTAQYL
jgi:hypothetical protein